MNLTTPVKRNSKRFSFHICALDPDCSSFDGPIWRAHLSIANWNIGVAFRDRDSFVSNMNKPDFHWYSPGKWINLHKGEI